MLAQLHPTKLSHLCGIAAILAVAAFLGCESSSVSMPASLPASSEEKAILPEIESDSATNTPTMEPQSQEKQTPPNEELVSETWGSSVESVLSGQSEAIHVEDGVVLDEDLKRLGEIANGKLLDLLLDSGRITDAAMTVIGQRQGLEHLRIRLSGISDSGIQNLCQGGNQSLRILNLPHCKLTEAGIRELRAFPTLVQLRLGGRQLNDAAMSEIAQLPALRMLHLIGPAITQEGLLELAKAPKLTSLYLDDCPLPDGAWTKLFEALPQLHVHIDQAHHDRDPAKH